MLLQWDNNLSVGVASIDNQHKELFDRVNQLLEAMSQSRGKEEIIKILDFLEAYVDVHFADEEEIQKKSNYPGYNIQKAQHDEFRKDLKELRHTFETSGVTLTLALATQSKMCKWWLNHITKLDKELGKFLLNK